MNGLVNQVDVERIYDHIFRTEGEKNVLHSPEAMEACADYICEEFERYGLVLDVHEFSVEGFDYTFRNIEGRNEAPEGPELLIASHYDTVRHAPGANDNGSAIAVMLEAARVIAQAELTQPIRFVSFNLEEMNPTRSHKAEELARETGIRDDSGRYTSWGIAERMQRFSQMLNEKWSGGTLLAEAVEASLRDMKDELSSGELRYIEGIKEMSGNISTSNWPGRTGLVGSDSWVRDAGQRGITVRGVLCLETMGYTSSKKHSQQFPEGLEPDMFKIFKTDETLTVGDSLFVIGDQNSESLADAFCTQCELESIELPYACLQEEFSYKQAAYMMRPLLLSDHAPFWRENIPALLLTDSAMFRYPFYHTRADTIDKLDFDFLTKICRAVVSTAIAW